jgi:outer membrane protein assembly factor BamA
LPVFEGLSIDTRPLPGRCARRPARAVRAAGSKQRAGQALVSSDFSREPKSMMARSMMARSMMAPSMMALCGCTRLDALLGGCGSQRKPRKIAMVVLALLASGLAASFSSAQSLPLTGPQNAPYGAPPTNALPPGAPAAAPRQLVVEVQVLGNSSTKDYEIQKHIHTRAEREFDPELVQADVRRLVTTGLFRDVKTFTRPAKGGVVVLFEVFERPRIHRILFLGNRAMSEKQLGKEIGLKVGDPLNSYSCEEARRKVEELYHSKGLPTATVSLLEGDQPGDKDLVLLINEGQVERIAWVTFQGNTVASDARLKTQIESKPGFLWYFFKGKVDRTKIDGDVEKLTAYYRSLGYFRARVGRELTFDDSGKWLTLNFIIDEGPRYVVRNVSVEGNKKFATKPLLGFLQLKSGDHFNQAEMNRDLNTLVDIYGSQGHLETVSPARIFFAFRPLLVAAGPATAPRRPAAEVRADLIRAGATMTISVDELRRQLDSAIPDER